MPDQFQYIKLPDGSVGKFNSNASDGDIRSAIEKDFPNAYKNAPTSPPSQGTNSGPGLVSGALSMLSGISQAPWGALKQGLNAAFNQPGGSAYELSEAGAAKGEAPRQAGELQRDQPQGMLASRESPMIRGMERVASDSMTIPNAALGAVMGGLGGFASKASAPIAQLLDKVIPRAAGGTFATQMAVQAATLEKEHAKAIAENRPDDAREIRGMQLALSAMSAFGLYGATAGFRGQLAEVGDSARARMAERQAASINDAREGGTVITMQPNDRGIGAASDRADEVARHASPTEAVVQRTPTPPTTVLGIQLHPDWFEQARQTFEKPIIPSIEQQVATRPPLTPEQAKFPHERDALTPTPKETAEQELTRLKQQLLAMPPEGPKPSELKPGQELPRALAPIKSRITPEMRAMQAPEAVPAPSQTPVPSDGEPTVNAQLRPSKELPTALSNVIDSFTRLRKQMSDPNLPPERLPALQEQANKLQQSSSSFITRWSKTLGPQGTIEQADLLRQGATDLDPKVDYLQRHLAEQDRIAAFEDQILSLKKSGQESLSKKHGSRLEYENPETGQLEISKGPPVGGIAYGARVVLDEVLGKRRAEVGDPEYHRVQREIAEFKRPAPELTDEELAFHRDTADKYQNALDRLRTAAMHYEVPEDVLQELKDYESILDRGSAKTHGHPLKSEVAAHKGVPTAALKETGAGKAVDISHSGHPVWTQKIQENEYGAPKGDKLWDTAKKQTALEALQRQQNQLKTIANNLERRVGKQPDVIAPPKAAPITSAPDPVIPTHDTKVPAPVTASKPAPAAQRPPNSLEWDSYYIKNYKYFRSVGHDEQTALSEATKVTTEKYGRAPEREQLTPNEELESGITALERAVETYLGPERGPNYIKSIQTRGEKIGFSRQEYHDALMKFVEGLQETRAEALDVGDKPKREPTLAELIRQQKRDSERGFVVLPGSIGKLAENFGKELEDYAATTGTTVNKIYEEYRQWIAPVSKVSEAANAMFEAKGWVDKAANHARFFNKAHEKFWDDVLAKFGKDEIIAFHDRMKNGIPQPNETMAEWERVYREKADDLYARTNLVLAEHKMITGAIAGLDEYIPTSYLEHYDRIMWKNPKAASGFLAQSRALFGTKGWLKPHVYNSMGEAIAHGLEPWDWNTVRNSQLDWHDKENFINDMHLVNRLIQQDKDGGIGIRFVKTGERTPAEYREVAGSRLDVYLKVPEGFAKVGRWAVHSEYARMFENKLSRDYIRGNAMARGVLGWRRSIGAWRLFGPFHMFAMTWNAVGAETGFGLRQTWEGMRNSDIGLIADGLKSFARAPVSAAADFRLGKQLQHADLDPRFWDTPAGQKLIKAGGPDVKGYTDLLWSGGAKNAFAAETNYRMGALESFKNAWASTIEGGKAARPGKFTASLLKTGITAPFAAADFAMRPVFEHWIPALKLGIMYRDLDISLKENAHLIGNGSVTEGEIARRVVRQTEDYFGELNLDNLYWNNTQRSIATMFYRSLGWRYGTMDAAWQAAVGQGKETFNAAKGVKLPKINPYMAHWMGLLFATGIASTVLQKALTGKNPESAWDIIAPQIGGLDAYGKPRRIIWANYVSRDLHDLIFGKKQGTLVERTPVLGYATGGSADLWQQMLEAYRNKDFQNKYIVPKADEGSFKGLMFRFGHAVFPAEYYLPGTFAMENWQRLQESGLSRGAATGIVMSGANLASGSINMSPAELEAQRLGSSASSDGPFTQEQSDRFKIMRELETAIRNDKDYGDILNDGIDKGLLGKEQINAAFREAEEPYLQYLVQGGAGRRGLGLEDSLRVYQMASPDEKELLGPLVDEKLKLLKGVRDPAEQERLYNKYLSVMGEQ